MSSVITSVFCNFNVVSGSRDKTIRIWDAATGVAVDEPLEGRVNSVAISPDGRYVISGSDDETVRTWDVQTGATVGGPLEGHSDTVDSVAFSPGGRYVVSGSYDRTIRIWDAGSTISTNWPSPTTLSSTCFTIGIDFHPVPDSNGWVRGAEGLLFWVPEDCRNGLVCPGHRDHPKLWSP